MTNMVSQYFTLVISYCFVALFRFSWPVYNICIVKNISSWCCSAHFIRFSNNSIKYFFLHTNDCNFSMKCITREWNSRAVNFKIYLTRWINTLMCSELRQKLGCLLNISSLRLVMWSAYSEIDKRWISLRTPMHCEQLICALVVVGAWIKCIFQ